MTLAEIRQLVDVHAPARGIATGVPRQHVTREDSAVREVDLAYRPMVCFVVAGAKTTTAGRLTGHVAAGDMFMSQLNLPVVAAYRPPYRSVTLDIDEPLLASVLAGSAAPPDTSASTSPAVVVATMDDGVVATLTRWVALAGEPDLLPSLAPGLERELLTRVLHSPLGPALRQAVTGGPMTVMRDLTAFLTQQVDRPVATAELAQRAGMSPATLFRHFRAATGMSPGQFHKLTRLQTARRLLAEGTHTAAGAAVAVGYASVPQFTRDYRRRYGVPPARDARDLRGRPTVPEGAGMRRRP